MNISAHLGALSCYQNKILKENHGLNGKYFLKDIQKSSVSLLYVNAMTSVLNYRDVKHVLHHLLECHWVIAAVWRHWDQRWKSCAKPVCVCVRVCVCVTADHSWTEPEDMYGGRNFEKPEWPTTSF